MLLLKNLPIIYHDKVLSLLFAHCESLFECYRYYLMASKCQKQSCLLLCDLENDAQMHVSQSKRGIVDSFDDFIIITIDKTHS